MKYLILVKHSLPEIEKDLPASQWKLSRQGKIRIKRLAEQLHRFQPQLIASSVEPKAKETAEILAGILQLEMHIVEDLHEHDRSNIPYLSQDQFQAAIRKFFEKPDSLVFGRESANQVHARFQRAVDSVLQSYGEKTVAIIAHGTVISLFVSRLTGITDLVLWNELGLPAFVVLDPESRAIIARENNI